MPFTEDICVIVVCDGCGDGWTTPAGRRTPHFRDYDAARRYVLEHGWTITPTTTTGSVPASGSVSGNTRLVCSDCTGLEACAHTGHEWGPWIPRELRWVTAGRAVRWTGQVRSCGACSDSEWEPPLRAQATTTARPGGTNPADADTATGVATGVAPSPRPALTLVPAADHAADHAADGARAAAATAATAAGTTTAAGGGWS
jgi:hypothetical protein